MKKCAVCGVGTRRHKRVTVKSGGSHSKRSCTSAPIASAMRITSLQSKKFWMQLLSGEAH